MGCAGGDDERSRRFAINSSLSSECAGIFALPPGGNRSFRLRNSRFMPSRSLSLARFPGQLPALLGSLLAAEYGLYRAFTAILGSLVVPLAPALRQLLDEQRRECGCRLMQVAAQIGLQGGNALVTPRPKLIDPAAALASLGALQRGMIARLQAAGSSGLDVFDDATPEGLFSALRDSHAGAAARFQAHCAKRCTPAL